MKVKSFLKLVEIQTKVASIFPFWIAIAFTWYYYRQLKFFNIVFMFISLLCIDMAVTAINNYMDYKRAILKKGYNFEKHNAIVAYRMKESYVITCIAVLLVVAFIFGMLLVYHSDYLVLLIGGMSVIVGILYSYGPLPISRTPYGEIFSGVFMGFFISFLAVYINIYDKGFVIFMMNDWKFLLTIDLKELMIIFFMSFPMIMCIANIMLANNICDLEDDVQNRRFTLPYYIGKKISLRLFRLLYYLAFLDLLFLSILEILPFTVILTLLTIVPISKFIRQFEQKPSKKDTFILAVKSFFLIGTSYLLSLLLAIIIQYMIH